MRRIVLCALVAMAVVLQVSWWPVLRPLGVVPDAALVAVVLAALRLRTSEAVILAAVAGVTLDLAGGVNFGLWTGLFIMVALVCGLLVRAGIELDRLVVAPVLVAVGTLVMSVAIWLAMAPAVAVWPVGTLIGKFILELVLNLALTMAIGPFIGSAVARSEVEVEVGG